MVTLIVLLTLYTFPLRAISSSCDEKLAACQTYVTALEHEKDLLYKKTAILEEQIKQQKSASRSDHVKYFLIGALLAFSLGVAVAK